ncbi:hypothetical protein D3C79_1018510 [compost metagenome]
MALVCGYGCGVNDGSPCAQMRECGLCQEKERKNIRAVRLVQLLLRDIQKALLRILYPVIVDQDIQFAEGPHGMLHRLDTVRFIP